ncbi:hypothetical protein DMA12_18635 [Amycolatopsis balhimycina DSM 5908]|uniref:Condensation domain-containing protein n=1 Tax=Amycolatopsis balhimycina DSM 5908 TaxID=1081091 RepID=A0A428WKK7_AMYBA|nr:hypothetical protein [Amycolatopsis balhimycina]RSM43608.1 hypothetical protein DMA12_18635 [Amycolatopsis balhimycina DSM 5908]
MTRLASDHAHRVVGLYGDPTVSWSILLEADLAAAAPEPEKLRTRLAAAIQQYPHLGVLPEIEVTADLPAVRDRFASVPYERAEPLVRVAVCTGEPTLLVAAHHGALDGLGLLSLLGILLDVPVSSGARGIGERPGGRSFALSALQRLAEALFAPPGRITPDRAAAAAGDVFAAHHEPRLRWGAAGFVAAAVRATERWNRAHGKRTARVVAAVGASRRSGAAPEPVHDSAFFRLRLGPDADVAAVLAGQPPEPDFPARSSRLARLGTRLLASRLGSTFLVSNLGVVSTGDTVRSLAFYPAASGRSGVAFGAATTGGTTTVTVRARRKDFDAPAATRLLDEFRDAVRDQAARP